jgi:hypothetical protein
MIKHKIVVLPPTRVGAWTVRVSVFNNDHLMLIASKGEEFVLQFFSSDVEAHMFVQTLDT